MELISPLALLFGLSALVPLILHLYQRRKRRVVLFSTNRFFTESIHRAQRRLQIRRWFLLLLRIAACLLLALALARPMMNLAGIDAARQGHRDLVILLDDSLSMQAVDLPSNGASPLTPNPSPTRGEGRKPTASQKASPLTPGPSPARGKGSKSRPLSRFDRAKELAQEAIKQMVPGDRATVVTFTGQPLGHRAGTGADLSGDLAQLVGEISRLTPSFAAGDAHGALDRAAEILKNSDQRVRLALVLSDLQAGDWRRSAWPQPLHPVATSLVQVGPPAENNVVAESMSLAHGMPVAKQPSLLQVRLINYRSETAAAELRLAIDGKEAEHRSVTLGGQASQTESIPVLFEEAGEHRLTLQLNAADAMPVDNTLYASVEVQARLPVMIVDGRAGTPAEQSAAYFLQAAMAAVSTEKSGFQPAIVRPADLPSARLDTQRVVVLSNVKELPIEQVGRLEQFVSGGGGLAIFLGDQSDLKFYNDALGPDRPLGGLMPARLNAVLASKDNQQARHILEADVDHPILQRFEGALRSALAGVSVYRTFALAPRESWVIAAMEERMPLVLERNYGQGKVVLFATSPQPGWCNLHQRRIFVPLVNRTISYLGSGGYDKSHYEVGATLVLTGGKWDYNRPLRVLRPDRSVIQSAVKMDGAEPIGYLPAEQVTLPGFYTLQAPSGTVPGGRTLLAVNAPRRESSPDALDLKQLDAQTGRWRIQGTTPALPGQETTVQSDALAGLLQRGEVHRGVWDVLILVVLALLMLEPLVANRFVRSGGDAEISQTPKNLPTKEVA